MRCFEADAGRAARYESPLAIESVHEADYHINERA
jgi:hypothetical protein